MKTVRNQALWLALVCSILIIVTGCGSNTSAAGKGTGSSGEVMTLKFSAINNAKHPAVRAINEKFKVLVEEKSNGAIKVEVFDNGQLGGERDVIEHLQLGTVHMAYVSPVLGNIDPKINILDLPYLFKDYAHLDSVLDGPLGQEILSDLPSKKLHGFAYLENGFRQVTNGKREINTPEDLKGLKVRVPEAPISIANLQALGANVVTLSFNELYSGLQQQVVDGQENAYPTINSSKFYEVQKYVAETNHMWGSFIIVGSEKWFAKLPDDQKKIIEEAAFETSKYQREIFREEQEKDKQTLMDNGMKVTTPDLEPFRALSAPVYEDFYQKNPQLKDLVERIRGE
ncbi:TRAP transporter substrate-binding protein [Paenibacillus sp. J2TS4]|uniref:TRAP transporter substrate-binding protein n=1 Tax=Paenibacillus sp. J2TS4 TaxID=2807194 RepID=UPI001B0173B7|nr:TRAP transporter substrate-binding protein [Paenibacillus sp. J2TS4]GIP34328.1 ABC transporter substrate-binding protein [Paenibacillus sp. J2TS4]